MKQLADFIPTFQLTWKFVIAVTLFEQVVTVELCNRIVSFHSTKHAALSITLSDTYHHNECKVLQHRIRYRIYPGDV